MSELKEIIEEFKQRCDHSGDWYDECEPEVGIVARPFSFSVIAHVLTDDQNSVAGWINTEDKRIFVNGRDSVSDQRLTVARLISRYFVHEEKMLRYCRYGILKERGIPLCGKGTDFAVEKCAMLLLK